MNGRIVKMEMILSAKNERVKMWKKLQTKKGREKAGAYLIEGFHLIDEANKEYSCEYCDDIVSMKEGCQHEIMH